MTIVWRAASDSATLGPDKATMICEAAYSVAQCDNLDAPHGDDDLN